MVGGIENEGESMPRTRKSHPPSLKAKVAIKAIKGHNTTAQMPRCSAFTRRKSVVGRNRRCRFAGRFRQRARADAPAFQGNLYWASGSSVGISCGGSSFSDLASWRAATGQEQIGTFPVGMVFDPRLSIGIGAAVTR